MEPIFVNTFTASVENIAEINLKIWDPKRKYMGWSFLAASAFIADFVLYSGKWIWIYSAVACAAYGIYNLFYHWIWAYDLIRKTKKSHNGQVPSATVTVTDKFVWEFLSTTMTFPFSNLKTVYFLKHSIRLIGNDNSYLTFQRNGFAKGSPEELEKFLQINCPQTQIIHKE